MAVVSIQEFARSAARMVTAIYVVLSFCRSDKCMSGRNRSSRLSSDTAIIIKSAFRSKHRMMGMQNSLLGIHIGGFDNIICSADYRTEILILRPSRIISAISFAEE